jgi:hypothetical protein
VNGNKKKNPKSSLYDEQRELRRKKRKEKSQKLGPALGNK